MRTRPSGFVGVKQLHGETTLAVVVAYGVTTLGPVVSGEFVLLFVAQEILMKSSWNLAA